MIELEQINKSFGTGSLRVQALHDINLQILHGEIIAVTGPSGAGKSTLLHVMAGLLPPSSGRLFIDGWDMINGHDAKQTTFRRRNIGFVFQNFNLIPTLTAEENLLLPALADGEVDPSLAHRTAIELLSRLGLRTRKNNFPGTLSGGEQQRTAIARAMMMRCLLKRKGGLLLADEPTGNLDSANASHVCKMMVELCREYDTSLVIATHDPMVAQFADRQFAMKDGELTEKPLVVSCKS